MPLYPGSLTQFFSARIDAYLIACLITDPSAPLGYYSMAVGLAELVFFFPNAVSTLFFPHVAESLRDEADRQVAFVSRVAFLVTAAVALALVPASVSMINILLPAFVPSLPPLLILLPGVVALSTTKVVYGYVTGIGRTAISSYINIFAFVFNVIVNLILIPRFGIAGASAASLVSYTVSAVLFTIVAARFARMPSDGLLAPSVERLPVHLDNVGQPRAPRHEGRSRRRLRSRGNAEKAARPLHRRRPPKIATGWAILPSTRGRFVEITRAFLVMMVPTP